MSNKQGGPRDGAGRKPVEGTAPIMKSVKLSREHWEKEIGGGNMAEDIRLALYCLQHLTPRLARPAPAGEATMNISPTALQDCTEAVQAFGCSMAQAAQALQAFGNAAKVLEAETRAAAAKRPWYRRGRW